MGLIEQGITSAGSSRRPQTTWTAIFAAVAAAAAAVIIVAILIAATSVANRPDPVVGDARLSGDSSMEYVEALRGTAFQRSVTFDRSYDAIERMRLSH